MQIPLPPTKPAGQPLAQAAARQRFSASPELDRITHTAARMFRMPMALVSVLDDERQWFRSRYGLELDSTPRDASFCAHAIKQPSPMIVSDAALDACFQNNPLVTGNPHIRFYAGHTIHSRQGVPLGTLCVLDTRPRTFTEDDRTALANLAMMAEQYFHLGEASAEAEAVRAALERRERMFSRIVDQAEVGIALLDAHSTFLECNRRFGAVTGHAHQQLPGKTLGSILAPEDLEKGLQAVRQVRDAVDAAPNLELRFRREDDSISWAQVGLSALPNESREADHLIVVATDINDLCRTQTRLEALQLDLEERINERTAKLDSTVAELRLEVARRKEAQAALEARKAYFQRVLADTSDAFIEIDGEDRIITWNGSAERIFGWNSSEAVGQCFGDLTVPPARRARHGRWLRRLRATGISTRMKQRIEADGLRRSGETFPLEMTFSTSFENGQLRLHGFLHDISPRKADEAALRDTTRRLKTITDNVPAMIAHIDADFRYRFHNQTYASWFDLPPQGLVGSHMRELWGEALFDRLRPVLDRVLAGESAAIEYALDARQGQKWFHANLVPHIDAKGARDGFYLLSQDISERKRLYERIEHEAHHDPLTGLPNRRALMERLVAAMARAHRGAGGMALMFMDLDGFKQINDSLGHEYGDALLKQFAANVSAAVRETDFVARLAGDEFVVVLEDIQPPLRDGVLAIGNAILKRINADHEVLGVSMRLASSIGVVLYDHNRTETPQQLLTRADTAMYEAKAMGKNQVVFR